MDPGLRRGSDGEWGMRRCPTLDLAVPAQAGTHPEMPHPRDAAKAAILSPRHGRLDPVIQPNPPRSLKAPLDGPRPAPG